MRPEEVAAITGHPGFGEVLRRHRREARLTLEQLAEASGVSARTLSDMERGRSRGPQQRTVTALADALVVGDDARAELLGLAREGRLRDHWTRPSGMCELPRVIADFTGRSAELVWIGELVYAESAPGVGVIGLITGSAGLGKTTFAVRAAHTVRASFPDGVLFLDLLGMSSHPVPADDALRSVLRALGVADPQIPDGAESRASLYRSILRERRVLVVLDNAASEEQVRPLLPAGGTSRALITTRRLLAGLEGVRRLVLGPMPVPEATRLLTGILGERAATDDEADLTRLSELCGGLPLALRIIGNRLASRPGWDAGELAARLADEERRLDQFTAGDLRIANAFGMSYEQLADQARSLFRRLADVPGPDFDAALAAVAGAMPVKEVWDALDDLVDLGLLQDSTAGRYRFHDLVRLFARERLREEGTAADRAARAELVVPWLLRTATMAGRWFEPGYGRPERPDPELPVLASVEDADRWLRMNVDNWLGALRIAAGDGRHALVLDCAESMHWFSDRWAHGPHWREVFTLGSEAAAALGDPAQQATQLNYLAWVHWVPPSDPHAVMRYAAEALELATAGGAAAQIAWSHQYSAAALRMLGRPDEAIASAEGAAETFRSMGDIDAYVQSLASIGGSLRAEGRHAEALETFRTGLAVMADEESRMTPTVMTQCRPLALIRVGQCLGELGRSAEAIATLTEGIALLDALRLSGFWLAEGLETLAALLAAEGRAAESRDRYARAARVFEEAGDAEASRRCRLLGTTAV
ncbi:helix-turn-helix domain-containing protein [Streptomyces sp. NBC_00669]|uniref:helix-turn-helix domain-containing protein n=1 Tax=Streptomyces sp. NBC_00669 TaxID=2976011 RepID=UPI002E361D93|nr:helix-turn-helix domain-containing protein [Streptomyces sp. NBC_00669]